MITDAFLDLLYPRRCPVCDAVLPQGAGLICRSHQGLPYVEEPCCMRCGKETDAWEDAYCSDCRKYAKSFQKGFPVFNYIEPVKSSVLAVKYQNKREYCDFYSMEIVKKIKPYLNQMDISGIVPVPMYRKKERLRGFNQAAILAKKVGKQTGLPVHTALLKRTEPTTPQKELNNVERANNIRRSVSVGPLPQGCRNILLIDDIYTTGITIEVCTELLLQAGVEAVYFATVCIGKGRD